MDTLLDPQWSPRSRETQRQFTFRECNPKKELRLESSHANGNVHSLLTFFQSPFDRAGFLANGVQVSVQCGHKEQAFRKSYCAGTAKSLESGKNTKKDAVNNTIHHQNATNYVGYM